MSMSWPQWVDHFIATKISGTTPDAKLKKTFCVNDLRNFLRASKHPSWMQASMFLQAHKHAQRWGHTDYMIRCDSKGPDARWVISNWEDVGASMETKIDQLSREHVNDLLCRARRFADGNTVFSGDVPTLESLQRETEIIVGQWNVMRSVVYHLKPINFAKSWFSKYVVV